MDGLTLFGLLALSAMLVFYALEDRSTWDILLFAGTCALSSVYGFLQGAWPFGVVEAIWTVVAGIENQPEGGYESDAQSTHQPDHPVDPVERLPVDRRGDGHHPADDGVLRGRARRA